MGTDSNQTKKTFEEWWGAEGWTDHDKANPRAAWTYDDLRETAKEAWDAAVKVGLDINY